MASKSKGGNKLMSAVSTGSGSIGSAPYKPTAADRAREMRYQAEDAIRTLTRAQEVKKDAKLMRVVKQVAAEQAKVLKSVCK